MRENKIRNIWAEGGTALTGWLAIPSSLSAELMAKQGWDAICVDLQHGAIDYQIALTMLQAISTTDATPIARVPGNDAAIIGKLLDAGAYGIICPMVNTRAQAEAFVRACRYPPDGHRSVGPLRASLYGGADYVKHANTTILTMAMIETAEAVENLDDILETPGLDAVYVGPSDLAVSMGESAGFDPAFPAVMKAIEKIAASRHQARHRSRHPCRLGRLWQPDAGAWLSLHGLSERFSVPPERGLARPQGDAGRNARARHTLMPGRDDRRRATVIGAGIVGVCCASYLQREGFDVEIVDFADPGTQCSFGNAGGICPGSCVPIAMPGMLKKVPGWLLDPEGPLHIRLAYLPQALPWLLRFLAAGRKDEARRISGAYAGSAPPHLRVL